MSGEKGPRVFHSTLPPPRCKPAASDCPTRPPGGAGAQPLHPPTKRPCDNPITARNPMQQERGSPWPGNRHHCSSCPGPHQQRGSSISPLRVSSACVPLPLASSKAPPPGPEREGPRKLALICDREPVLCDGKGGAGLQVQACVPRA